jgi:glycosyltransferase involved in cell wall biosynthesis
METLISESGLVGVIEIHDATKFIDDWYFKSLIFVQSSRFEGMPNSLLEAMAHGLSVIATLNAGSSIITHQEDGLLVPTESVSDLVDAIALLVDNVDLRNRMGKKALRVRHHFASSLVMPMWIVFGDTKSSVRLKSQA